MCRESSLVIEYGDRTFCFYYSTTVDTKLESEYGIAVRILRGIYPSQGMFFRKERR